MIRIGGVDYEEEKLMNSEPTNEEWRKLYDAALKFKAIEAWDWMYEL
ncbi:MAG: hypothetical protein L0Y62_05000 [Nitrospirae bacterium]|nr:hypothetical protein [Nitrospirota bacterium]